MEKTGGHLGLSGEGLAPNPRSTSPPSSGSSPAVESCTSAQKNELAGSQLLGCQGQPIGRWGHLAHHQGRGPGAGPEGLEGGPCLRPVPRERWRGRNRKPRAGVEVVGTESCTLRGTPAATSFLAAHGHTEQVSQPQPGHSAFSHFFLLPCSPPCPQVGKSS